ncbi:hypothetical protein D3C86_1689310 [compost metagenome]
MLAKPKRSGHLRRLCRNRVLVEGQNMREDDSVCQPVRQVEKRAERIGNGVTGRRIDRAETDAAIIGSEHHAFSRFGIRAIADGARQIFAHQ